MAKSASTYQGYQVPALQTDTIGFDDDFAAFKTHLDAALSSHASNISGSANAAGGTSYASNAGKILSASATSPSPLGRVFPLSGNTDSILMFQENPGGNTTGNDKWVIGYDDSSTDFVIHDAATIPSTVTDARLSISATSFHVTTNDSGATASGSYDDLVVEVAATGGISIISPDATETGLVFGNVSQPINAAITMQTNDKLRMFTSVTGGEIILATDVDTRAFTIDSSQNITTEGGSVRITRSGVVSGATVSPFADDFILDNQHAPGISLLTANGQNANIFVGEYGKGDDVARIQWDSVPTTLHFGTNYAGADVKIRTDANTKAVTFGSDQSATFHADIIAETNLDVEGYAAIGDGSSLDEDWTLTIDRDFSSTSNPRMLNIRGIMTVTSGTSNLYGIYADTSMNINSSSAEVHGEVSQFYITDPDITLGGSSPGSLTLAATLHIDGVPTEATKNAGIWVQQGSSSATPDSGANEIVVETSSGSGISILSPNSSGSRLYFGSPADANGARLMWHYNNALLELKSYKSASNIEIFSGTGGSGITVAGNSGNVTVDGTTTCTGNIIAGADIGISGDTDLMELAADQLTVNGDLVTSGDLIVDGTNIGLTGDLDLFALASGLATINGDLTLTGDLIVDGTDIGITADTDLIGLASTAVTVNGSLEATSFVNTPLISLTGSAGDYIQVDSAGSAPATIVGSIQVDAGGATRYIALYSSI